MGKVRMLIMQDERVIDSWPKEGIEMAEKIYDDFNKEHGPEFKFQLK